MIPQNFPHRLSGTAVLFQFQNHIGSIMVKVRNQCSIASLTVGKKGQSAILYVRPIVSLVDSRVVLSEICLFGFYMKAIASFLSGKSTNFLLEP